MEPTTAIQELISRLRLGGPNAAEVTDEAADAIERLSKELAEARALVIEECAAIAEEFARKHGVQWDGRKRFELQDVQRCVRGAGDLIAEDIRTLTSKATP